MDDDVVVFAVRMLVGLGEHGIRRGTGAGAGRGRHSGDDETAKLEPGILMR